MIRKSKSIYILLLLYLVIALIPQTACSGGERGTGYGDKPSNDPPIGGGGEKKCDDFNSAGSSSSCGIVTWGEYEFNLKWDFYDENGNLIDGSIKNHKFTAGRFIGLDIYEEYKITMHAEINPSCYNITLTCVKTVETTSCKDVCKGEEITKPSGVKACIPDGYTKECKTNESEETKTVTKGKCPKGYTKKSVKCESCNPPAVSSCRKAAADAIDAKIDAEQKKQKKASYQAYRLDVNDIEKATPDNKIEVTTTVTTDESEVLPKNKNSKSIYKISTQYYMYVMPQACINIKTAQITYRKGGCSSDEEKMSVPQIKTQDKKRLIGQYYIPLNTKTNTKFYYYLQGLKQQTKEMCQAYIDKYSTWREELIDQNKQAFKSTTTEQQGKNRVKSGCYFQLEFEFKTKQQFYNEESKKFEGYAYYYRPIDIYDPFPNGVDKNSLWYKLYDSKNNSIIVNDINNKKRETKLDDAYKTIMYKATDVSTANVAKANETIYTSWEGMNKNGTSSFIKNNSFIRREAGYNSKNLYKIGCGPANANWGDCK